MPLSHHPCININEHESFGGLFHHPMEENINTKKGITKKHAMLQHWKDQLLIEIKRYVKLIECQLKVHMGYDGKMKTW